MTKPITPMTELRRMYSQGGVKQMIAHRRTEREERIGKILKSFEKNKNKK